MTGRIHSFESFGTVDGPGIRFVVFMQGCPMRCLYCHNPDTQPLVGGREYGVEQVAAEALKYRSYFSGGGGVTVTGGEPLMQLDFVIELFALLKARGVHTALDTSGILFDEGDSRYAELIEVCDLVLLDIKHIDGGMHKKLTGHPNKNPLAFARYLSDRGRDMWIRHVLLTGYTDSDEYLYRLAEFIGELKTVRKVEVLPYHTLGEPKYRRLGIPYPLAGVQPPSRERYENAVKILNKYNTD